MGNIRKVSMFTGIVRNFTPRKGETAKLDINDKPPMVIEAIGGVSPRPINLISGTVAEGQDLQPGKNYIFKAIHTGEVESTVNEGEMIEGSNISSVGEIDVEKAIQWYEDKGLHFMVEPEMDNERGPNYGPASQEMQAGKDKVKPSRERQAQAQAQRQQPEPEEEV